MRVLAVLQEQHTNRCVEEIRKELITFTEHISVLRSSQTRSY